MTDYSLRSRLVVRQLLTATKRACNFFAVIVDPDTGERLQEVLIYTAQPGERVELALEREKII